MGACTIANRTFGVLDGFKVIEADVTFSTSYATNGDTVARGDLGLRTVDQILIPSHKLGDGMPVVATTSSKIGLSVALGGTTIAPKLLAYDSQDTEVTSTTNLSARGPIRVRFLGTD